jgi:transcriptional regulator with GAF, ATPase, and Fis domain
MGPITELTETARSGQVDQLALELSSLLAAEHADDMAAATSESIRRIGEALGMGRVTFLELLDDHVVRAAYHWSNNTLPAVDLGAHLPRLVESLNELGDQDGPALLQPASDSFSSALPTYPAHTPVAAGVVIPLSKSGRRMYAVAAEALGQVSLWPATLVSRLRVLGGILAGALERAHRNEAADHEDHSASPPIARDDRETAPTVVEEAMDRDLEDVIGRSKALKSVLARVKEVIPTDSTVLLLGETGTGKELIARALHTHGPRRAYPLISVNCAALPPTLIESELFGHERGAFTGAVAMRAGRFQLAHRGTLFLDEIAELPLELQGKLLRVLELGEFERLGATRTEKVNVRIIAATNRDLAQSVAEGEFREDLYYRLSVFPIRLPPLRERREDIPALVWFIIRKKQQQMHRSITRVPADVMAALQQHSWPGNVRELENVVERALIHSRDETLHLLDDLEAPAAPSALDAQTLSAVERKHIEEVLHECRWRINGVGNAAERLGLHPNTLRFRMKKLGIVRSQRRTL